MRIDMEFPSSSEPRKQVKYNVEHERRNYIPAGSLVLYCLLNKYTNDDPSDDFRKMSEHSLKTLQNLSKG